MSLPRLRLRTLMIAMAVVALLLHGKRVQRHRQYLAEMCAVADRGVRHTGAVYRLDHRTEVLHTVTPGPGRPARSPAELESRHRRSAYWVALKQKYDRAASRPWLPVSPDPPTPE